MLRSTLTRWLRDDRGNFATTFSLAAPVLVAMALGGVDITSMIRARAKLQQATDTAALALAADARVSTLDAATVTANANRIVTSFLTVPISDLTIKADSPDGKQFTVQATQKLSSITGKLIGTPFDAAAAKSTAKIAGTTKLCVVGLDPTRNQEIKLDTDATIQGNGCSIVANSTASDAIYLASGTNASITASRVITAGGSSGKPTNPVAITGAKPIADPMANYVSQEPPALTCPNSNAKDLGGAFIAQNNDVKTLPKGIYCQPVIIQDNAVVTLEAGAYHFNKQVKVDGTATLNGEGVTLFFHGSGSGLRVNGTANVALSGAGPQAPTNTAFDRTMSGVLLWQHSDMRSATGNGFELSSPNITKLTGIVYIPDFPLTVQPDGTGTPATVAQSSPWTALIVRQLIASKQAKIVLNTNYSGAPNTPAPETVRASTYMGQPLLTN